MSWQNTLCTAFQGNRCIASGALKDVALAAKTAVDDGADDRAAPQAVLIFNDATSEVIELDWRGTRDEFAARLDALAPSPAATAKPPASGCAGASEADSAGTPNNASASAATANADVAPENAETPRGPGRPRLGVVAREVTLLPRHWAWLATQPGGASVALRKLVEVARRTSDIKDRVRQASEVGYKFMSTMAGQMPGFEEASRALFAGDQAGFEALVADWPVDIQTHLKRLLSDAFWA